MESYILLLGLLALPTWTTVATMPTLMRTFHQRAPTSMVSIQMPRLGSSPPPLKTSSALYLRCSQEMHLQEEEVAPPGRKRFAHVDIKVVASPEWLFHSAVNAQKYCSFIQTAYSMLFMSVLQVLGSPNSICNCLTTRHISTFRKLLWLQNIF